ncbi:hypothetical protein FOMPIDRAFT_58886, partial [Fomitopsis schrenkii]
MIATAKKYGIQLEALRIGKALKKRLPAWYHLGAINKTKNLNNKKTSECMRNNHGVRVVADLVTLTTRDHNTTDWSNASEKTECTCEGCRNDERKGCKNPVRCCEAAKEILDQLPPKWHPDREPQEDGLTLTTKRHGKNREAKENGSAILFNPTVTERGGLTENFRIFTKG